ncbi:MAG TPA: TetR/AcrR family transcriptional regulator [Baekduia sp.]|uniref:TetR/AcrR family transcriptional regulator n=1 Tax=Baekduia sp. TaxID=2600305 RepID=UPI002BCDB758|nr:TetR/AcrR family transcriptional regulator [Baekduia sp.]HMJ36998.1 TetR/AcrR family transcriptional regulator [Baekduia sp.]
MPESKKKRAREPYQLPAGRHGLPRQFVVSNQRERILAAVADVCSTAGYVSMSVEDIVVTSGVSRRTFYDNYRGKEDVFLAAYDEISERLLTQVKDAYDGADGLVARARESLGALLGFIASEPTFADMCIVEVLAAGPQAIERRNAIMHAFATMIDDAAAAELPKSKRPAPIVAETLVGGIYEVIYSRVLAGKYAELPALLPDLVFALLLPYVGSEAAGEILKKERRKLSRVESSASA